MELARRLHYHWRLYKYNRARINSYTARTNSYPINSQTEALLNSSFRLCSIPPVTSVSHVPSAFSERHESANMTRMNKRLAKSYQTNSHQTDKPDPSNPFPLPLIAKPQPSSSPPQIPLGPHLSLHQRLHSPPKSYLSIHPPPHLP